MAHHYTNLGAVPAIARRVNEQRDALLARTGPAARSILYQINKLPRSQRRDELNRVLAAFDSALPSRLHRTAEFLHREGMPVPAAMERGLALSLADASIERLKQIGHKAREGRMFPVGGFGLGEEPTTQAGRSAGDVVAGMFQGIACSADVAGSTTTLVGSNEGADAARATTVGFAVARGMAQCPRGLPPEPPVAPPPESQEEQRSLVLPVVLGVTALAAAGGVVWFVTRKK